MVLCFLLYPCTLLFCMAVCLVLSVHFFSVIVISYYYYYYYYYNYCYFIPLVVKIPVVETKVKNTLSWSNAGPVGQGLKTLSWMQLNCNAWLVERKDALFRAALLKHLQIWDPARRYYYYYYCYYYYTDSDWCRGHCWKLFPWSLGNIAQCRLRRRVIFPKLRGNNFQ